MHSRFTHRARSAGSTAARSSAPRRRAAFAAVEALEQRALFDAKIGDVFYIALENHNFTQPASDITRRSSSSATPPPRS